MENSILALLHYFFLFVLILEARAEILEKISLVFWKKFFESKRHFEINWPNRGQILSRLNFPCGYVPDVRK